MSDTRELWLLDFRPSVPTRYERPDRMRRVLHSPAAVHLRAASRAAFWPTVAGCGVLLALVVLAALQNLTPVTAIR